jgi:regulator of replication initiation timing
MVHQLDAQVSAQAKQIQALQQQVSQLLTPNQVADLVWQKIKDINYLYRIGFVSVAHTMHLITIYGCISMIW